MASTFDEEMVSCTCRRHKAFIGIDMGATHSGISRVTYTDCRMCHKNHENILHVELVEKFPTLLATDSNRSNIRFVQNESELFHHETVLTNFKLLLPEVTNYQQQCHTKEIVEYINKTTLNVATGHREGVVVEMVREYLHGLIKLMLEKSAQSYPHVEKDDMKIIFTYPEFFQSSSGNAFLLFSEAINGLDTEGITSIDMLPEHSAALKASLFFVGGDLWKCQMANEWVVVADCGGMTVDAVLCRVPAPNTCEDTTQLQELVSTLGGGVWIDQAMDTYARQHLGTWPDGGDDDLVEARVKRIMDHWHNAIKPRFTAERRLPYRFALGNGLFFSYPTDVITSAMQDVIRIITNAVAELWQAGHSSGRYPKALILSGGLAQQNYIKAQVLQLLRETIDDRMLLFPPDDIKSWNWVASGAALSELSGASLYKHASDYSL